MADALGVPAAAPRLLCDGTLGALSRWLRLAGYDTAYSAPRPRTRRDSPSGATELLALAQADDRILLTRSRRILALAQAQPVLLVEDDMPYHQVVEVAQALSLKLTRHAFTRCREDNAVLQTESAEQAGPFVPPYVAATQQNFRRCPHCGRRYWGATHRNSLWDRLTEMEAHLAALLA